jgi:hypothetical protein
LKSGLKNLTDGRVTGKKDRVQSFAKYFESATVRISDANTPFLNALRRLFDDFGDLDPKSHDPVWDVADSVFHALRNMPDVLSKPSWNEEDFYNGGRVKQTHPLMALAGHKGYG